MTNSLFDERPSLTPKALAERLWGELKQLSDSDALKRLESYIVWERMFNGLAIRVIADRIAENKYQSGERSVYRSPLSSDFKEALIEFIRRAEKGEEPG